MAKRGPKPSRPIDRFMRHVEIADNGCWLWRGAVSRGYGVFSVYHIGTFNAHRWSWILHYGTIPDGAVIDHLCMVKMCVNPEHLEPVSPRENTLRWHESKRAYAFQSALPLQLEQDTLF